MIIIMKNKDVFEKIVSFQGSGFKGSRFRGIMLRGITFRV